MRKPLTVVGLPDGNKVLGLAYHQQSRTLITHVGPLKEIPQEKRLYFRWATETSYQAIGEFSEGISIDSFLLDPGRPSLYFLTWTWKEMHEVDTGGAAGNWDALYRFDLEKHWCTRLARRGDLLPTGGYQDAWLCNLLTVGADGGTLFCQAALKTPRLENGARRVDYWVAELNLASLKLEPVAELTAIFA